MPSCSRTGSTPCSVTSGRIQPGGALVFGLALSLLGFVELWLGVNLLSALIGAFTLLSYLCLYTPLKQRSWLSTTVGAIPGAMPPLIGYAAGYGLGRVAGGHSLWTQALISYALVAMVNRPQPIMSRRTRSQACKALST